MKENSIEENIEILEKFKNNEMQRDKLERDGRCGGWKIGDIYKCLELDNAIDNILSDYKRVLKENEQLRKDIEGWKKYCEEIQEEQTEMSNKNCELEFEIEKLQKENEELKQDRNNNYQMIALAQNEMLGYIKGYEDGKKLKKSAVAFAVENQEYYLIRKEIEHYKEHIVKLQKESEKLKNQEATARKINELLVQRYSNSISLQKVKDLIEELKNKPLKINQNDKYYYETDAYNKIVIQVLQELLEGRKLKKHNDDLLRKLRNRVKEVKKLEKYSLYKEEFSKLNKQLQNKEKIIDLMANYIATNSSSLCQYLDILCRRKREDL